MSSQKGFLQNLAQKCKEQFDEQCDQLTVIFPNKRSGLYFAKHLSELYEKPIWSPRIYSFEEYVTGKQDKLLADDFQLLILLYQAYCEIEKKAETFDAFMPWGEMILSDFNDIDNYLVDPEHIFHVVKSQKELDESFHFLSERDQKIIHRFWKGFIPTPTKKQDEFVKTWAILSELYNRFNELLESKNLTYKGQMMRAYAEGQEEESSLTWFAGFNALTKAEETLIKRTLEGTESDIFWEVDEYYFSNETQESGAFFREYAEDRVLGPSVKKDLVNRIQDPEKSIQVVGAPLINGQVLAATQIIDTVDWQADNTLIVLTDESMLDSLLRFLPREAQEYNITMGVPIGQSRVYQLGELLVRMGAKLSQSSRKSLYYTEIERLYDYGDLLGQSQEDQNAFSKAALDENKLNYSVEELSKLFPVLEAMLGTKQSIEKFLTSLMELAESIYHQEISDWDRAVAAALHQRIKHLHQSIVSHSVALDMLSFARLFQRMGNQVKIPTEGDIHEGTQIMGVLETRNLSFDHVVVVGMNEGKWPSNSSSSSFIPYNIRKAFDLPVIDHQDAMQSYLFYRLVQNAKDLSIIYNNVTEYNHNGELSRYVQQLKYESGLKVQEKVATTDMTMDTDRPIMIQKSGDVLERLNRYLADSDTPGKALSPSAINSYLECRLRFYFRYVDDLYEPDELIEDMDPGTMGNILHQSMEHLYEQKEAWDEASVLGLRDQIEEAVTKAFEIQKIAQSKEALTGRHLIAFDVVKKYIEAILAFDQKNTPFEILGLEENLKMDFPIDVAGSPKKVRLKGIIDRIDRLGEVVRIMDYKSGRDDRSFKPEELMDREADKRNKAAFQLLYYSMLYQENNPDNSLPIRPGLFNSKDLFDPNFDSLISASDGRKKTPVLDYRDHEEAFTTGLTELLTEIFNPTADFTQTDDEKKCTYCPYQNICMRV